VLVVYKDECSCLVIGHCSKEENVAEMVDAISSDGFYSSKESQEG